MIKYYPDEYRNFGSKEQCFFCATRRMGFTRLAFPSYFKYKSGVRTNDMRAYWVCPEHLYRCKRVGAPLSSHEELVEAVRNYDMNPPKRGRKAVLEQVVELIVEKKDDVVYGDTDLNQGNTEPDFIGEYIEKMRRERENEH